MSCPHLLYEELFTEIGKAWDTSLNDNGLAITILDKTKEEIQKREGEGERKYAVVGAEEAVRGV